MGTGNRGDARQEVAGGTKGLQGSRVGRDRGPSTSIFLLLCQATSCDMLTQVTFVLIPPQNGPKKTYDEAVCQEGDERGCSVI